MRIEVYVFLVSLKEGSLSLGDSTEIFYLYIVAFIK